MSDKPTPDAPEDPRPLALRPAEAAKMLGIGQTLLWTWTNQRRIPHTRIGRAVVYPVAALEKWLAEQAAKGVRR